jgi:hypothetical protein
MIALPPRRRRAIGVGLTAYGLVGMAAGLVVVVATIALADGLEPAIASVDRQRDAIVATLESGAASLEKTAVLIDDAAGGVQNTAGIASEAADVSRRIADTLSRLAGTFGSFQIFGNQPFAPLASDATQLAAQLRGIATDLDALGIRLDGISGSLPPLAKDVQETSTELATLAGEMAAMEVPEAAAATLGWLVAGIVILVAWLLAPAIVALAVGMRLLRAPPGMDA